MLRREFASAEDAALIPFGRIRIDKLPTYKAKPAEKRALSDEEKKALFSMGLTEKESFFILSPYNTGLRREEAIALTCDAFDYT